MPIPCVLGLDIGGANLKAAHSDGAARLMPFALWRSPEGLLDALRNLMRPLPRFDMIAITMTGESCDCYETKRQGVVSILDAILGVADQTPILVWTTSGSFTSLEKAKDQFLKTASANWLALATFAGRYVPAGPSLLIDIGSTTTDIVPLLDGTPTFRGRTDRERLKTRELVYTGVRRTPLCALLGMDGAAELFATTLDVHLLFGDMPENSNDQNTADGRPATRRAAHARLARMSGADLETFSEQEAEELAQEVVNRQLTALGDAVMKVASDQGIHPDTVVISGEGEFLARRVVGNVRVISLGDQLGPEISRSACAYAVAKLAQESMVNQPC
jgi:probable H4MPT-linked C1 transfer pathway protein